MDKVWPVRLACVRSNISLSAPVRPLLESILKEATTILTEGGVYKGRPVDQAKHDRIRELLEKDFSIRKTAEIAGAAPSTVQKVKRQMLGLPA